MRYSYKHVKSNRISKKRIIIILLAVILIAFILKPGSYFSFTRNKCWKSDKFNITLTIDNDYRVSWLESIWFNDWNSLVKNVKGNIIIDGTEYDFNIGKDPHFGYFQFGNGFDEKGVNYDCDNYWHISGDLVCKPFSDVMRLKHVTSTGLTDEDIDEIVFYAVKE